MHNRTRTLATVILLAAGLSWSAVPAIAAPVTVIDEDGIVFRGGAGAVRTYSWTNAAADVGKVCTVTAVVDNGESEHLGNVLDVGPLRAVEIEADPFGQTTLSGQITLAATNSATITLDSDPATQWRRGVWVFSGDLTVSVDCPPDETTTTTSSTTSTTAPTTTTTTAATTTTTAGPGTTTTTVPDTTSTTDPATSTTVPGPSTSSTVPPVEEPDCEDNPDPAVCLPFTGPEDVAALAMAGSALLLLGYGVLLAARSN